MRGGLKSDAFYADVAATHGADVLDRLLGTLDIDAVTSALGAFLLREENLALQRTIVRMQNTPRLQKTTPGWMPLAKPML